VPSSVVASGTGHGMPCPYRGWDAFNLHVGHWRSNDQTPKSIPTSASRSALAKF
jgi:hypothetical protein